MKSTFSLRAVVGAGFLLLLANSGYIAAFANPTIFYMTNVLAHLVIGVLLAVLFAVLLLRDAEVRRYDEAYNAGGWTRLRLRLKVATDPFEPHTERQLLLLFAALTWFMTWRRSGGVR